MKQSLLMQQVVGFSLVAITSVVTITALALWHVEQVGDNMTMVHREAVVPLHELRKMERAVVMQELLMLRFSAQADSPTLASRGGEVKKLQKQVQDVFAIFVKDWSMSTQEETAQLLKRVGVFEQQSRREQKAIGELKADIPALERAIEALLEVPVVSQRAQDPQRAHRDVAALTDRVRAAVAELALLQQEEIGYAVAESEREVKSVKWQLVLAGGLVIVLAIVFAVYLGKRLTDPIRSAVASIAAAARQQEATAREIATTTAEIGATSTEISATSKELGRTMEEVAAVAEKSADLAGSGQAALVQMGETMRHVGEAATTINAKLGALSEKAANINQVVVTIAKVADQTNLLSLNAAIEAEKAGEYGRGFSVVASEIRRLADQTAEATGDIEQIVREIQSAVSAGVMGMDKFSEEVRRGMQEVQQVAGQLSQIIQQVQAQAGRFEAVNEGMQVQATGAEEISQTLLHLSESAQQTVESLEQLNGAVANLSEVAHGSGGGGRLATARA